MDRRRRQRGVLLIAAIILLVVVSALVATMAFVTATSGGSATDNLQSGQALYVAESGLEFEQRCLAQNVDWYRSTTDPVTTATCPTAPSTQNIGQGTYTVQTTLPATALRTRTIAGSATANVFTTQRFTPAAALTRWLLIEDDPAVNGEFVTYTGTTANSFTGLGRSATVGTVPSSGTVAHNRGDNVLPVTQLNVALVAACATIPNPFTIKYHQKFLTAGTITVFHNPGGGPANTVNEEISYSGSTVDVGLTTITVLGVQRCRNGTIAITASVNDPVTPLTSDASGPDFEAEITSTGTVGNTQRQERKTVQRQ